MKLYVDTINNNNNSSIFCIIISSVVHIMDCRQNCAVIIGALSTDNIITCRMIHDN